VCVCVVFLDFINCRSVRSTRNVSVCHQIVRVIGTGGKRGVTRRSTRNTPRNQRSTQRRRARSVVV